MSSASDPSQSTYYCLGPRGIVLTTRGRMESPYVGSHDTAKEATTMSHQSPYTFHSGLEVAPDPPPASSYAYYKEAASRPPPVDDQQKTILGLRRPTFFLLVALWIVVIAAAVGGGVGGSIAVSNARK